MADEPQNSAPIAAPEAAEVATPQSDPTPAQVESKSLISKTSREIDDLWAKAEGKAPQTDAPAPEAEDPPADETPAQREARVRDEKGRFVKSGTEGAEAPLAEAPPEQPASPPSETPAPVADRATLEQQAYEQAKLRIEREQEAQRAAAERIEAEQRYAQEVEVFRGPDADMAAIGTALRQYNLNGDTSLLDAIDVTLMTPAGPKRVSELKQGAKGLTPEEAATVLSQWETTRKYEDVLTERGARALIGYWDAQTQAALADPDVDADAVRSFRTPGEQIKAAIDTTRAAVEKRLSGQHAAELAARDKTIAEQAERISSLVNERGNLTSQQMASRAATPDRPGQPGALRRDIPTPDQLREMSADEAFKSGAIDRVLQSLPGGISPLGRRRAG